MTDLADNKAPIRKKPRLSLGQQIALGLLLGIFVGVFFGEYCAPLEVLGHAYVGLLQMTVLPYLVVSIIANMGRLDAAHAKRLGMTAPVVLLALWAIGVALIVATSAALPPNEGATFYSGAPDAVTQTEESFVAQLIPTNVFRSLTSEYVPGVVVFCLFFGASLMLLPRKETLLEILDICAAGVERINHFLVRLAPVGLFTLAASAAGTLRMEELSRLQAYLLMLTLACVAAAFAILPLLVSCLTTIRFRDFMAAAQEPLMTAIATGKLFVVLPQIEQKCEELISKNCETDCAQEETTASIMVPLAYTLPHLGKILTFVFISFAAWYVGQALSPQETVGMAMTGVVSSFASPLVSIPNLLDMHQLPNDLMFFFILPGFITMRLGDAVGVTHLMAVTLITNEALAGRLRVRWSQLAARSVVVVACLVAAVAASRAYLDSTALSYDLDDRLLSLEVSTPHAHVAVYSESPAITAQLTPTQSTLEKVKEERLLRVGYHPDHLPYSFFNSKGRLVGLDVELMHRLASRLEVTLHFLPYSYDTLVEQLDNGEIDLAVGGLTTNPERLMVAGFTHSYQSATIAIVVPDHRRLEFTTWDKVGSTPALRLAVLQKDVAAAARRMLPRAEIVAIDSLRTYFEDRGVGYDGLLIAAEEGAAWNVLYPEQTVVVPKPLLQRPVGVAVRLGDGDWARFLEHWLEFERMEGSLDRLRAYWVQGGGTLERPRRWSIVQDELEWLP